MTSASNALGGVFQLTADRKVGRVGFGAMQLAGPGVFGPPADRDRAVRVLRRAVELGIDHIDTSDFYGPWVVNELIAEALRPYGDDLVLATKIGAYRDHHGSWLPLNHPDALRAQVHDNLRRLHLDALDLVYLRHTVDRGIPLADQLGALTELREQGLVRAIGLSNVSAEQYEEAQRHAEIAAVQNLYNVVNRTSADLLAKTAAAGAAFVPFFPLGSGFADSRAREDDVLRGIAERHGATQAQVSLAWLLRRADNVLLIPGTSSPEHLEENTAAATVELSEADVAALNALVAEGETLEEAH
ncbi:oxidoreductase [Saccharopolyspora hirsuta]|uniref:Oxidoreductase n=1 Tax=Saccharopolyspora hirsuta TaxID=1837 RepID=A0A5M7BVN8_SACHI|nr:oxidoreductase [Saccharopolyspora hirsuta]KAA5831271.1 oxidoreductase [Saccharopolyspora hirsuta]